MQYRVKYGQEPWVKIKEAEECREAGTASCGGAVGPGLAAKVAFEQGAVGSKGGPLERLCSRGTSKGWCTFETCISFPGLLE